MGYYSKNTGKYVFDNNPIKEKIKLTLIGSVFSLDRESIYDTDDQLYIPQNSTWVVNFNNMKEIVNLFITKGLPMLNIQDLECYSSEWMSVEHPMVDVVLPHLINQKLIRYEEEY